MNRLLLTFISTILFITCNVAALAQTEVLYDFNTGDGLDQVEQVSGSVETLTLTGITDNGVPNSTKLLHPKTVGSPNSTGVANLNAFPVAADYSVTWKEYLNQGNTTYKKGFLLRANNTGGYTTGIKRGYYFMVQNNSTTGSVNFRIMNSSASAIADLKNSGAVTIPGFAVKKACWFRATVDGNVLTFSYSTDGVNFNTGASYKDGANMYSSGGTQLVYGIASGVGQYYYDDVQFKSLEKQSSSVAVTGSANYIYNGTPQGPQAATVSGSTGALTFTYSGTGSTFYGPSFRPPIIGGTYQVIASVAADENFKSAVSDPFAFTINSNPEMPVVSLRRPLSPTKPMWLIHADVWAHQPQEVIDLIPEDIRPFVVINISLSTSILGHQGYDCAESWLNTCAQNGIWAMVQPASGIENSFAADTAISKYESLYKKYSNFIGYNFCEQAWGFNATTFPQRLNLFSSLLAMGHKYGGYLYVNDSFSLSNAPFNSVSKFKTSSEFANATRVYKDNMIFGDKFTSSWAYYDNESGALGAFMSGHAGNYAIRYDMYSWGWSGRGKVFGEETLNDRNPDGNRSLFGCPEAVMGIPIVEHMMMTGATVIDAPEVPWMSTFYKSYRLPAFNNMIADVFRKVLDGSIRIPTVTEVAARTKVAFVNDVDANTTDSLFSGIYAMDGSLKNNRTWFKKSGRYATIPQLYSGSAYETSLFPAGSVLVKKSQYKNRWPNEQSKINEFNSLYPEEYNGDMYVARVNNSLFSYNPWINKDITTRASIPLKYNTCDSVSLSYPAHTFSVINESADKLKIYLNNYRTDKNYLWEQYPNDFSWYTLQNTILPEFAVRPTDGSLRTSVIKVYGGVVKPAFAISERGSHQASISDESWSNGIYTLSITHNGPVDLTIDCSGSATGRLIAPVSSALATLVQPLAYSGEKQYEAEGGIITSPAGSSNDPKLYHGTGFVKFSSTTAAGSSVKFKVLNIDTAGTYALDIRYSAAQGNVSRVDVLVNGLKVATPAFPATATDSTWTIFTQKVSLNAGQGNTIELRANAPGALINIDKIYLAKRAFPYSFVTVDAVQKNSSQIQVDWRVTEERELVKYEVLKSTDGISFSSVYTVSAKNTGDSYYAYLENAQNSEMSFKIRATDINGLEIYSPVVKVRMKVAVFLQAESGTAGSDWETKTASDVTFVTSKTDVLNAAYPGNASKVVTYHVAFEKAGSYDLYARIWVGPGAFNDDSFYYGKGFGSKNSTSDNNEWVTSNGLSSRGYIAENDIVSNAGSASTGVWKWLNVSRFNGGETPVSFDVPLDSLQQIFQIGGRENGLQIDKLVFGSSGQTFTVKELDSLASENAAPEVLSGQTFIASETVTANESLGSIKASDANRGTVLRNWRIAGGTGATRFAIDSINGTIRLLDSARLDYDSDTSYTLDVTVSDGLLTSSAGTVTIAVVNENDNIPVIVGSRNFVVGSEVGITVGVMEARDADDSNQPGFSLLQNWRIVGGSGVGLFDVNAVTGMLSITDVNKLDYNPSSYNLSLVVSDGLYDSQAYEITIFMPEKVMICHKGNSISISRNAVNSHLAHGCTAGACSQNILQSMSAEKFTDLNKSSATNIYPNPVEDKVHIDFNKSLGRVNEVVIVDLAGRVVWQQKLAGQSSTTLSIGQLKAGVYVFKIIGDTVEVFKMLKK